jgi:hypothetical protein
MAFNTQFSDIWLSLLIVEGAIISSIKTPLLLENEHLVQLCFLRRNGWLIIGCQNPDTY